MGPVRKKESHTQKNASELGTGMKRSHIPKRKRKIGQEERKQNMVLFKSRYEKELDALMTKIDMNMSNNYKDNAQADFQELESRFTEMKEQGRLKEKTVCIMKTG